MCLKPVTKRGPQHARRRARRSTLHNEMLAIKKISRVAAIKRKRLESWERRENRRRPLPTISQHVVHSKSALPRGKRIHRRRIPMFEIKVAECRIWRCAAPREKSFCSVFIAVRGPVPLLFCGKRLPRPARISLRLCVAHIDRPVQRQRNFFEHAAIKPSLGRLGPKHRMSDHAQNSSSSNRPHSRMRASRIRQQP